MNPAIVTYSNKNFIANVEVAITEDIIEYSYSFQPIIDAIRLAVYRAFESLPQSEKVRLTLCYFSSWNTNSFSIYIDKNKPFTVSNMLQKLLFDYENFI